MSGFSDPTSEHYHLVQDFPLHSTMVSIVKSEAQTSIPQAEVGEPSAASGAVNICRSTTASSLVASSDSRIGLPGTVFTAAARGSVVQRTQAAEASSYPESTAIGWYQQLKVGTAGMELRVTSEVASIPADLASDQKIKAALLQRSITHNPGKSLCMWFGFEIAVSNLLEICDRLRVRQSSRMLCQELPSLPMGHQAVARNNRVIMRYLSFHEEAKLAISCNYLAKVFDDSSRSLYWHSRYERDIRDRREHQDHEYISDGPDYYYGDSDSAEPLFDNRSRFEFIPSEDAEDDAAWS